MNAGDHFTAGAHCCHEQEVLIMLRFFGVWYLATFAVNLEIYVSEKQQRNAIHQVFSAFSELIDHYVEIPPMLQAKPTTSYSYTKVETSQKGLAVWTV